MNGLKLPVGVDSRYELVREWYDERLRNEGRTEIMAFGVAFCRKRCRVMCRAL